MYLLFCVLLIVYYSNGQQMDFWLTDPQRNILFQQQPPISPSTYENLEVENIIEINPNEKYQSIDGFGCALTGGSAFHLYRVDNTTRASILEELFRTDKTNIGISYLRLSIGSSDLNDAPYSYDDIPDDQTDLNMTNFTLDKDRMYVIPILKEILSINPQIKLLGSPWSAPVWMKTNKKTIGGHLKDEYFDAYALYFLKYIQGMQDEGINIDAITIQNEPLYGGNNPSMVMHARQQADFIKKSLGPLFEKYSIKTKIIIYDHNPDRPDYPIEVLLDPEANKYVDGSAFHMYAGSINALSLVHDAYPDKNIYFTEQWVGAPGNLTVDTIWHVKTLTIGATRNWAKTVLEWNLANGPKWEPHTPKGCDNCLGAITVDQGKVIYPRNPAYYTMAHAAKFVRPNSTRIQTNLIENLNNVAFKRNEDGKIILIVVNDNQQQSISFSIKYNQTLFNTSLNSSSVATFIY